MGRSKYVEDYRNAFNAAVTQRDQIREEIEFLKSRRALVEEAARMLEPLIYPDEYPAQEIASSQIVEINHPVLPAELDPLPPTPEQKSDLRPVAAVTQVYVRGEGESADEIQRRIDIALGRTAAD
jgi:hypothetical protein